MTLSNSISGRPSSTSATSNDVIRQGAVVVAFILTIAVNALANILPIGGMTTGELSDLYDVLIVPAGYVFSIWSLIYLGLGSYVIFQSFPSQRTNPRLRAIGWPFVISCILNSSWIVAWHYQYVGLSVLVMLGILLSLATIYVRLSHAHHIASRAERITTHWTFSVYLGWITVATIANISTFLVSIGYGGQPLTPALWSAILLGIATCIGLYFVLKQRDIAYALVLVWAFIGIFVKFGDTPLVGYTAATTAVILVVVIGLSLFRSPLSSAGSQA